MPINIYYDDFLMSQCYKQEDILSSLINSAPNNIVPMTNCIRIVGLLQRDIVASHYLFELLAILELDGSVPVSYKGECLDIDEDNFLDFIKRFNIATLYNNGKMLAVLGECRK